MRHAITTTLAAVVFILATCYVFIPELRAGLVDAALWPLAWAHFAVQFWRLYASGLLTLTPSQIFRSQRSKRQGFTALTGAASIMAVVALIVSDLRQL